MKSELRIVVTGFIILFALIIIPSYIASAATINVPGPYSTIQAAINAASPGDTIVVSPGIYHESLVISKKLTITGTGSELSCNGYQSMWIHNTSGTVITGNKLNGNVYDTGIGMEAGSNNSIITGNTFNNNHNYGLYITDSGNKTITSNTANSNFRGVKVDGPRTLTLNPGWNMVGWTPAYNSTAKTFGSLNPHINKVSKFSTATSLYTTYIVGASGDDKNFQMTNGNGYFVYNNATTTITINI